MTSTRTTGSAQASETFRLEGGPSASLLVGIGIALVVEGIGLHLWIAPRSQLWAWVITAANVATLVWLWREHRSRATSTLTLGDDEVVVALGNQLNARFPRSAIASVSVATWRSVPDPQMAPDYVNGANPLEPNVMLVFHAPVDGRLPFGIRKRIMRLGVRVADPGSLISSLSRDLR